MTLESRYYFWVTAKLPYVHTTQRKLQWKTVKHAEYCAVKRYNNCHFAVDYNVVSSDYFGLGLGLGLGFFGLGLGLGLAYCGLGLGLGLEACGLVNITAYACLPLYIPPRLYSDYVKPVNILLPVFQPDEFKGLSINVKIKLNVYYQVHCWCSTPSTPALPNCCCSKGSGLTHYF